MELVQDLFLTASFALILSFLVAKLVAMAVAGREPEAEFTESENAGEGVVMEEVSFEENRLKVEESFRGQRRVEFVGELKGVDQFEGEPVHRVEEIEEPLQRHRERRELTEKVSEEEGLGEESVAAGLPEKSSDGVEKVSVEKASDSDHQNSENRGVEEIGAKSETDDVVSAQSEEVRAVAWDEIKGKGEANEVKLDNISDEDDWEGIEKSELDDDFTAAVKSEGR